MKTGKNRTDFCGRSTILNRNMTYYNILIAEKLKTLSEISRINSLIDMSKKENKDFSDLNGQLEVLKTELELLNNQILGFKLKQTDASLFRDADPLSLNSSVADISDIETDLADQSPE